MAKQKNCATSAVPTHAQKGSAVAARRSAKDAGKSSHVIKNQNGKVHAHRLDLLCADAPPSVGPPTTPKGQIGSSSPIGIHCAIHCHALWLPYPAMPPRFVEREGGAMPAMLACQTLPHCAIPCHALLWRHWQWPYGHACHTGAKTPIAPPQFVQLKGGATPEGQGIISDTSTLA